MAVPDSLSAWRRYVIHSPTAPERLMIEQVRALAPSAKERYNEERFEWLGSDVVLDTKDILTLESHTHIARARGTAHSATARRGLAVSGPAGLGKSTAALYIGKRHERDVRDKAGREGDTSFAPVVYAVVPPGTTPKMLMLSFANWLGLMTPSRATAQLIAEQVLAVLRDLGTSLVIVDEVHNLTTNHQAGAEAASALKGFSERLDATFIYAGIDLLQRDLFAGDMGKQMKARMIFHQMRPYGFGSLAQRDEWADLVAGLESLLPLALHQEGELEAEATYLYDRTGGSIGALRALLNDAAVVAIMDPSEHVTRKLLDAVTTDQAASEHHATAVRQRLRPRS
jgi:hypothetical protein